ncbi:hypothetical protein [Chitinophaga barathri]|nr:hypothetical protein [Chitinophaga barathri]
MPIGSIKLDIPQKWDTMFTWQHYSCTIPPDETKYRFQPKTYPVFLENGSFWDDITDSVDQLTISHQPNLNPGESDWSYIDRHHQNTKDIFLKYYPGETIDVDTILTIGELRFSILTDIMDEKHPTVATTLVNAVPLRFTFRHVFKHIQPDPATSYRRMIEVLKSLRITSPPPPPRKQG